MRGFLCVVFVGVSVFGVAGPVYATALDDYVNTPDPAYGYTLLNTIPGAGYTDYVLQMTSQTWRDASEVDVTLWTHHMVITVPDTVSSSVGVLFIGGGSSTSGVPGGNDAVLREAALETNSVCALLKQIPNQPITFLDDPALEARKEDSQIAYAWDKFLRSGDPEWLSRFPMTKAAARAMDTVSDFVAQPAQGNLTVNQYVVAGASKRGWTTWTTAAVDNRVVAFAPFVIDMLSLEESFLHHYAVLGFWADAIIDYESQGIMEWQGTRPYNDLIDLVDPYSYLSRYASKPKYVYNSAGDEFFLPDSSQFYYDDLPGQKSLRYLPNTGHGLDGRANEDFIAWYNAIVSGDPIPNFTWVKQPDGSIVVDTTGTSPSQVLLWQASNSVRDFNHTTYGNLYTGSVLAPSGGDTYTASVPEPASGFTAFFVEITYPGSGTYPLRFTTEVSVIPDTYVASWDPDTDEDGEPNSVDTDDDNDGEPDVSDYRPLDTDNDALPNHVDDDDDNDGFPDALEVTEGTDPLDNASYPGAPSTTMPVAGGGFLALLVGLAGAWRLARKRKDRSA